MYGALASDVADASAGSGARRAVCLISAVAYCQLFKSYISVSHITSYFWPRRNLSACLLTGRFDQSPAGQKRKIGTFICRLLLLPIAGAFSFITSIAVLQFVKPHFSTKCFRSMFPGMKSLLASVGTFSLLSRKIEMPIEVIRRGCTSCNCMRNILRLTYWLAACSTMRASHLS